LNQTSFYEVAGAVAKIGSSLKLNQHWQIKLAKISETHGTLPSFCINFSREETDLVSVLCGKSLGP
jgi:hypothetical protein